MRSMERRNKLMRLEADEKAKIIRSQILTAQLVATRLPVGVYQFSFAISYSYTPHTFPTVSESVSQSCGSPKNDNLIDREWPNVPKICIGAYVNETSINSFGTDVHNSLFSMCRSRGYSFLTVFQNQTFAGHEPAADCQRYFDKHFSRLSLALLCARSCCTGETRNGQIFHLSRGIGSPILSKLT